MKFRIIALIVSLTAGEILGADNKQDGNFWRSMPDEFKSSYVAGVLEGFYGGDFFVPGGSSEAKKYRANLTQGIGRATVGPLVDGLNEFYTDFKNRNIHVCRAVLLVAAQINGADEQKIKELTEGFRSWDERLPQ